MFYNWNIIGHEKELEFLESKLLSGSLHHGYLFIGLDNIGKFVVIKTLAQILQCPNNFCKKCHTCVQIAKGCHLDTIEIRDDGTSLKIEQIRDLIARLNMTSQSKYKIVMMENIGRLTEEAGNSILKILEEPPPKTFFFFTSQHLSGILPTIRSRVFIMRMKPVSESKLKEVIAEKFPNIDKDKLEKILFLSFGQPGRVLQFANEPEKLKSHEELFEMCRNFYKTTSIADRFRLIQKLSENPAAMKEFIIMLTAYLRQLLLYTKIGGGNLAFLISELEKTSGLIRRNINPKLAFENFAIWSM